MRIAMWSGPRNLSTAMMYSFGNRADFAAWDEPFYAPYLAASDIDHPMKAEIVGTHNTDPDAVAHHCVGDIPNNKLHFYMKHMPHQMMPDFPFDWAMDCVNIHLIRHPARVVASYTKKRDEVSLEDVGFQQQIAVYEALGGIVIDSADVRADPERMMMALCGAIGLEFDPAMLAWPAGPKSFDGVWAQHWYDAVHKSTGFAAREGPLPEVAGKAAQIVEAALPSYRMMESAKLLV